MRIAKCDHATSKPVDLLVPFQTAPVNPTGFIVLAVSVVIAALRAAEFVAAHTQPGELVALAGDDWDPSIFYYARREGLMVLGAAEPDVYARLRELGYTRLFVCPLNRPSPATACDIVDLTSK